MFAQAQVDAGGNEARSTSSSTTATPPGATSVVLFEDGFEKGELGSNDPRWNISGNAPIVTQERVRSGLFALKTYLHRYESKVSYRTEVRWRGVFDIGKEYWYGFSVLLLAPYPADSIGDTVAQWHSTPDVGEADQNPPLALHVKDGRWFILTRWNASQPTEKRAQEGTTIDLGNQTEDEWTDWVFRVRWSYGSDGYLQVWKNGVQVIDRTGPNCFHDARGPYFKMGLYKSAWRTKVGSVTERVLYHDEVRIAGAGASYADVAPRPAK